MFSSLNYCSLSYVHKICVYVGSYEKLISGMYMGEIARRIIVQCVSLGCLFNGQLTEEINTPHRFYTKYVSEIEK